MSEALAMTLSSTLDHEVRGHFDRAFRAMWRDLDRLVTIQDPRLSIAMGNSWTRDKIRVVAVLSAFSRVVIGPLAACYGRNGGHELGHSISVKYGKSLTVNDAEAAPFRAMLSDYDALVHAAAIPPHWLHASRLSDLVYYMSRTEEDDENAAF